MALPNDQYWTRRAALRMASIERQSLDYILAIRSMYDRAAKQIEVDIEHILHTYEKNGELTRDAELLRGSWKTRDTSWHYAVDQNEAYRSIPEDEVSWHAGDGANGTGNNETVSIETCINTGGHYEATLANAAELAADILFRHGARYAEGHLFQHHDWSGKNCPAVIRANNLWQPFVAAVQQRLTTMWEPPAPKPSDDNTYTILPGDTLWGISRNLNLPLQDLLDANTSVDPYQLRVGQVILLPGKSHVLA